MLRRAGDEPVPVVGIATATERQFWLAEQIAPAAPANRALLQIRLDGAVDARALEQALQTLGQRHEALRTGFAYRDRQVVRLIRAAASDPPPLVLPPGTGFEAASAALSAPELIDLAEGRVHRAAVAVDGGGATVFVSFHHIAFDGISGEIICADLARVYAAELNGGTTALESSPLTRQDPVPLDPDLHEKLVAYWREVLDGVLDLPADGPEPGPRELFYAKPAEHRELCAPTVWQSVRDRARSNACSPYAVLLAAYGGALSDMSGAADFCVGTPVSIRSARQSDEVGSLINTVPIRVRDLGAPDVIRRLWASVIDAMQHVALPSEQIVRSARPSGSRRMPVYQAVFSFHNWPRTVHNVAGVRISTVPNRPLGTLTEVQVQLCELDGGVLEAVFQAPADGGWAGQLPDLARRFVSRLAAPATPPGAAP